MSVAVPARTMKPQATSRVQPRPTASASSSSAVGPSAPAQPQAGSSVVAAAFARKAAAATANTKVSAGGKSVSSPSASATPAAAASSSSSSSTPSLMPPGKDTSSSAGKIFVKPSKEWVLPERAKPGRKVSADEPDDKRQSQNRLSQRAHRARKTDYIQTLEERLRQYEADEIHSNVRLQEVARALKADNERLKVELAGVKTQAKEESERARERHLANESSRRNSQVEVEDAWARERQWMEGEIRRLQAEVGGLKVLLAQNPQARPVGDAMAASTSPSETRASGPSEVRRAPLACPICPDPDPDCPCQQAGARPAGRATSTPSNAQVHLSHGMEGTYDSCGLCSNTDECLCRVIEQKPDVMPSSHVEHGVGVADSCGLCTSTDFCACRVEAAAPPIPAPVIAKAPATSGIDRSSSYQALPLRKKKTSALTGRPKATIWRLDSVPPLAPAPGSRRTDAMCTGDPSNCDACRDDRFGQEFCGHLFNDPHPAPSRPCPTCPGNCMSINSLLNKPAPVPTRTAPSLLTNSHNAASPYDDELLPRMQEPLIMACCGQPELCGHGTGCVGEVVGLGRIEEPVTIPTPASALHPTMRPDEAWRELKAHPNAKFASLALLADVVARRTICSSSGSASAEAVDDSAPLARDASAPTSPSTRAVHAALHDHHHGRPGRSLKIDTSAVREALRILDETAPGEKRYATGDGIAQREAAKRARRA